MRIRIDRESATPVSAQLVDRLRAGIRLGRPAPGERLPPVRTLAEDLGLAPNTVAKAYRLLEREGYLEARGRGGTFVARALPASPDDVPDDVELRLEAAATAYARRVRQLGASETDAVRAVRSAYRRPAD